MPIWSRPVQATHSRCRELSGAVFARSANGVSRTHASAMRRPPNQSGGRSRSPILIASHVEPQTAHSATYIARVRPRRSDMRGSYRIGAMFELGAAASVEEAYRQL